MLKINLIPKEEFDRIAASKASPYQKCAILADMCRLNTLAAVKLAGSGHIGSSFSAMDIAVWLYYQEMNTPQKGWKSPDRDIYFSSKGHDVPGLYSIFYSLGVIPEEKFLKLRKLGGLDGHPDVGVPGIESNTGSLGMGISKGRGMAWAKKYSGQGGHVYVLLGDGELQEGQIYESLQTTLHQKITGITVIVDHNKFQTDRAVSEITDLGDLEVKFKAFGWYAARCDGHDFEALDSTLQKFKSIADKPKILIADTIKGKGVSFMEPTEDIKKGKVNYRWHSGAPDDASFMAGYEELLNRTEKRLKEIGLTSLSLKDVTPESKKVSSVTPVYVADAYGRALVEIAEKRKDIVVLDGDLSADCRIRYFEEKFPDRFIENGIAEQDMVSMAGGLARQGLLPIVNTFASFLSARANEQIYNNACEKTKIIYVCHFAGLIPAGPGKSHQSVRDISLFGALPNCTIIQPCNEVETRDAVYYAVEKAKKNCVLRLVIGPSPRKIEFPQGYQLAVGQGVPLTQGQDAILFAYGPVMLHEALTAAEILAKNNFTLQVVNMPWLNCVDSSWLKETTALSSSIFVLEDHSDIGGLGDTLLNELTKENLLQGKTFRKLAIKDYPVCGTPQEVLSHHGLDGASLAQKISIGRLSKSQIGVNSGHYTADAPQ